MTARSLASPSSVDATSGLLTAIFSELASPASIDVLRAAVYRPLSPRSPSSLFEGVPGRVLSTLGPDVGSAIAAVMMAGFRADFRSGMTRERMESIIIRAADLTIPAARAIVDKVYAKAGITLPSVAVGPTAPSGPLGPVQQMLARQAAERGFVAEQGHPALAFAARVAAQPVIRFVGQTIAQSALGAAAGHTVGRVLDAFSTPQPTVAAPTPGINPAAPAPPAPVLQPPTAPGLPSAPPRPDAHAFDLHLALGKVAARFGLFVNVDGTLGYSDTITLPIQRGEDAQGYLTRLGTAAWFSGLRLNASGRIVLGETGNAQPGTAIVPYVPRLPARNPGTAVARRPGTAVTTTSGKAVARPITVTNPPRSGSASRPSSSAQARPAATASSSKPIARPVSSPRVPAAPAQRRLGAGSAAVAAGATAAATATAASALPAAIASRAAARPGSTSGFTPAKVPDPAGLTAAQKAALTIIGATVATVAHRGLNQAGGEAAPPDMGEQWTGPSLEPVPSGPTIGGGQSTLPGSSGSTDFQIGDGVPFSLPSTPSLGADAISTTANPESAMLLAYYFGQELVKLNDRIQMVERTRRALRMPETGSVAEVIPQSHAAALARTIRRAVVEYDETGNPAVATGLVMPDSRILQGIDWEDVRSIMARDLGWTGANETLARFWALRDELYQAAQETGSLWATMPALVAAGHHLLETGNVRDPRKKRAAAARQMAQAAAPKPQATVLSRGSSAPITVRKAKPKARAVARTIRKGPARKAKKVARPIAPAAVTRPIPVTPVPIVPLPKKKGKARGFRRLASGVKRVAKAVAPIALYAAGGAVGGAVAGRVIKRVSALKAVKTAVAAGQDEREHINPIAPTQPRIHEEPVNLNWDDNLAGMVAVDAVADQPSVASALIGPSAAAAQAYHEEAEQEGDWYDDPNLAAGYTDVFGSQFGPQDIAGSASGLTPLHPAEFAFSEPTESDDSEDDEFAEEGAFDVIDEEFPHLAS